MTSSKVRYVNSGGVHIAYRVFGDGPLDLILVPAFTSHLEQNHEWPGLVSWTKRLASFSRLIVFDKRSMARAMRSSVSPGAALAWLRMITDIDVREALPQIRVPTVIVHRTGDRAVDVGASRYAAGRIPGARLGDRPRRGRAARSDPPFPESKQLVAGYWILQVQAMEEAVEWAERFPFEAFPGSTQASTGAEVEVEIRQVFEPEPSDAST